MEIQRIKTYRGVIVVWRVSDSAKELERKIALSDCESEYYNSISSENRRAEWLMSRVMVRHELGDTVSTEYKNRIPYLVGSEFFISISHSDDLVAIYLSEDPCGIDIEDFTRNFDRVASRFLSNEELIHIQGENIALAWSIKEAAYKKIGVPDIDFATMFTIKEIDRETNSSILSFGNNDYKFKFSTLEHYNIIYSR